MKTNYHTHTYRCHHAKGTEYEIVASAVEQGFDILGITDHCPHPDQRKNYSMDYDDIGEYIQAVQDAGETYKDLIEVHVGFEAEWIPKYASYYDQLLSSTAVEYLILGQHYYFSQNSRFYNVFNMIGTKSFPDYAKFVVEGMSTGLFKFIAHPDIIMQTQAPIDDNSKIALDMILDAAVKNNYILEFNGGGFRRGIREFPEGERYPYPYNPFWEEVAKTGLRVIIGSDAHTPTQLFDDGVQMAHRVAADLGLNVIEKLDL